MKKSCIVLVLLFSSMYYASGQAMENYSDDLLTSSFKIFQSADFELANHMLPFIRSRFINELKDSSSFSNTYDSLSNYVGIKYAPDSLLKTYCWSERSGGCCHTSATFAQFKTKLGNIDYVDLEKIEQDASEIFITDLQMIVIDNNPFYLILGWGTCCGGKHYEVARVYEMTNNTLVQADSVFANEKELYIGANRSQKIELNYAPETKILSYNSYLLDKDVGFYTEEKAVIKWKLKQNGFERMN